MVGPPTRSGKLLPRDLTSRGAHNRVGGTDHDQGSHLGGSGRARRGDGGVRGGHAVGRDERAATGGENERGDGVLRAAARSGPGRLRGGADRVRAGARAGRGRGGGRGWAWARAPPRRHCSTIWARSTPSSCVETRSSG